MILTMWHDALDMEKFDLAWHKQDLLDEFTELQEAKGFIHKWSELSDVAYTYSRAKWSGHLLPMPISRKDYIVGIIYMYPKYTLRYLFFRSAGKRAGSVNSIKAVRNPKKVHKLHSIAEQYSLNKKQFQIDCEKQLKYWPLLP